MQHTVTITMSDNSMAGTSQRIKRLLILNPNILVSMQFLSLKSENGYKTCCPAVLALVEGGQIGVVLRVVEHLLNVALAVLNLHIHNLAIFLHEGVDGVDEARVGFDVE